MNYWGSIITQHTEQLALIIYEWLQEEAELRALLNYLQVHEVQYEQIHGNYFVCHIYQKNDCRPFFLHGVVHAYGTMRKGTTRSSAVKTLKLAFILLLQCVWAHIGGKCKNVISLNVKD